jgi:wobble nucleotide-excising tRNase
MIQKIIIKETPGCFDSIGIEIDGLKKVNYFYGSNGSGKTTISKVIGNCEGYRTCRLLWENNRKLETMVYNRDFIDENFYQSEEIKGIFTLGKDSREIQELILKKYEEINKIEEKLDRLKKISNKKQTKKKNMKIYMRNNVGN